MGGGRSRRAEENPSNLETFLQRTKQAKTIGQLLCIVYSSLSLFLVNSIFVLSYCRPPQNFGT